MTDPTVRLSYLATSRVPSTEANSIHVMRMAQALSGRGCEVQLVALAGDPALGEAHQHYGTSGFEVVPLAEPRVRGWRPWGRALRARRCVRRWGADAAYGRDPHGLLAAAASGVPVGYELHQLASGRRRHLEARLLRHPRLRVAVFITAALEADYLRAIPALATVERLVAPDGADRVPTSPPRPQQDPPRIGYVGHLYRGRGIELIGELATRLPTAAFEVVGGTAAAVEQHRAAYGHLDNLRFTGSVPPHAVGQALATFDVVLAPYQSGLRTSRGGDTSRWMSPLKVFEYMAHGRAIVASALPVLGEVLTDGENALLVGPDDVDGWEAAVRRLLADDELRHRIGDQARSDLDTTYSWDARAGRILERLLPS